MRQEFTQWWFFAKIQAMRARQRKLSAADKKRSSRQVFVTWTMCVGRNKCKMRELYLGKRNPSDLKNNSEWNYCITWQRRKLLRLYDPIDNWRKLETRILDRMCINSFPRDLTPNVLWKKVVNRQIWKVHQRTQKKFVRVRTKTDSFDQVIRQGKARMVMLYQSEHEETTDLWEMTIKANKLRIHTSHIRNDWVQTICGNLYKLLKRENVRQYRQGVFGMAYLNNNG